MKKSLKFFMMLFLMAASFYNGIAQQENYLPGKEEVYYVRTLNGPWELSTVKIFKYNSNGDVTLITIYDGEGVPLTRDSMVYNSASQMIELYKYYWNLAQNKFVYVNKIINCFENGQSCGSIIYLWDEQWKLSSGSEIIRSYDHATKTEEIISRYFDLASNSWKNAIKEIIEYDDDQRLKIKTIYSTDPSSNDFILFSRHTYKGWHNYGKSIYTELINEKYVSDSWEVESTSTITSNEGIWINVESRLLANETYRILFKDDNSYQEVMQAKNGGWIILSVYNKAADIETLVENEFDGDNLKSIRKKEIKYDDSGRQLQYIVEESAPGGFIKSFSDVKHEFTFNQNNHLIQDIAVARTTKTGPYQPAIKTVYSDYTDVSIILGDNGEVPFKILTVYPNPGKGVFYLKIDKKHPLEIKLYNIAGTLVYFNKVTDQQFDVSHLPSGVYLLHCHDGNMHYKEKIILQ